MPKPKPSGMTLARLIKLLPDAYDAAVNAAYNDGWNDALKAAKQPTKRFCKSCEAAITQADIVAGSCTQCGARIRKTSDIRRG